MSNYFEINTKINDQKFSINISNNKNLIKFSDIYHKLKDVVKIGANEEIDFQTHDFELFEGKATIVGLKINQMSHLIRRSSLITIKPKRLVTRVRGDSKYRFDLRDKIEWKRNRKNWFKNHKKFNQKEEKMRQSVVPQNWSTNKKLKFSQNEVKEEINGLIDNTLQDISLQKYGNNDLKGSHTNGRPRINFMTNRMSYHDYCQMIADSHTKCDKTIEQKDSNSSNCVKQMVTKESNTKVIVNSDPRLTIGRRRQ